MLQDRICFNLMDNWTSWRKQYLGITTLFEQLTMCQTGHLDPRGGGGGAGGTLVYSDIRRLGSFFFFFWGGGVKILNFNIFWVFRKMNIFVGVTILWIFFGSSHI